MVKLRNSKNRSLVLDIITKQQQPISAEKIFQHLKNIQKVNLSTVYRILSTLTEHNLIHKYIGQDGIYYYEINDNSHKHNIICDKCHKTVKIDYCPLKELENSIKKETHFNLTSHIIEFHGICEKCKKN